MAAAQRPVAVAAVAEAAPGKPCPFPMAGPVRALILGLLALPGTLMAQNEEDALRISDLRPAGTGRSSGMANAFGALGADPASISINPAGFGLYRTSDISLTPAFEVNDAGNTYHGTKATDTRSRFFFGNMALVLHSPAEKDGPWRGSTFGVVYDRQATHHWRRAIRGDVGGTFLQGLAGEAYGTPQDDLYNAFPFSSGLAWETYGIDPDPVNDPETTVYQAVIPDDAMTRQQHGIVSRGASNSTSFFYAGNYLDRLYIGASIGLNGHRFRRTTTHEETTLDEGLDLATAHYREELTATGNGLDVKVGVIGRVTERFRMGLAFHSPQWMRMSEAYTATIRTTFRTPDSLGRTSYTSESPDGNFSYRVHTPWRAVLSAAYIAGPNGLFSLDYEYADMRKARFRPNDQLMGAYDFAWENEMISDHFVAVHTVRVGTEWRTGNWYYRLGWAYSPDSYVASDSRHGDGHRVYAGGIGYRTDHVGVDLGLNYTDQSRAHHLYQPWLVEASTERLNQYRAMLTVSLRP